MHSRTPLKLHFADFWPSFSAQDNPLFGQLFSRFDILLDPISPDYVIFSVFGFSHLNYDCVKIFYTGECQAPDFNLCDYAIAFEHLNFGDRYLRFPEFAMNPLVLEMAASPPEDGASIHQAKTGFCNFVYSNKNADPTRGELFRLLCKYKKVDSPGSQLNNMTSPIGHFSDAPTALLAKIDFQSSYKFSIACENASSAGYTTEKIIHAFAANTVPIYWGDPTVAEQFNPEAFINCHEFDDLENVVAQVIELDNDEESYFRMLEAPCFTSKEIPEQMTAEYFLNFFDKIFAQPLHEARRRPHHGRQRNYRSQMLVFGKVVQNRQGQGLPARFHRFLSRLL